MYAKIENDIIVKYPILNLRQECPNVSFPQDMTNAELPIGYVKVHPSTYPQCNLLTHKVVSGDPVLDGDTWVYGYIVEPLTEEELQISINEFKNSITMQTQMKLDDFAKTRNYDSILSACTYATSVIPQFQAEGQLCVNYRDQYWSILHNIINDIESGIRPRVSSFSEIESEFPELNWV